MGEKPQTGRDWVEHAQFLHNEGLRVMDQGIGLQPSEIAIAVHGRAGAFFGAAVSAAAIAEVILRLDAEVLRYGYRP